MGNAMYRKFSNQSWANYPSSPELTSEYPYQAIWDGSPSYEICLLLSKQPMYEYSSGLTLLTGGYRYTLTGGAWTSKTSSYLFSNSTIPFAEANNDIYTNSSCNVVFFAKTIEGTDTKKHVRNIRHLNSSLAPIRDRSMKHVIEITENTDYQQWENYSQTPVLTSAYPYQFILKRSVPIQYDYLVCFSRPMFIYTNIVRDTLTGYTIGEFDYKAYWYDADSLLWYSVTTVAFSPIAYIIEANNDVYANQEKTIVYFAKTTSDQVGIIPGRVNL